MRIFRALAIVTGVTLAAVLLPAQPSGPSAGGGAGNGPGGGSAGGSGSPGGAIPRGASPSPFPSESGRPIFLSGKVVLSDGLPLSESVLIERICSGVVHAEARADAKGRFSFQLGQSQEAFLDLSDPLSLSRGTGPNANSTSGVRSSELSSCDLRASLPGYRSDLVSLASRRSMDNPDIGTIVLHRLGNVEGLTVSAVSARAPKEARKAYEKGLEASRKGKTGEAQRDFERAVAVYPRYASAWLELGKVDEQKQQIDEARKAYAEALAADSKYVNPYERLYLLAFKEAHWEDLADTTQRVIHLNPYDFPGAYYFNAVANLELNRLDLAEKSAREAVKLDTGHQHVKTSYVLGIILAKKHDFAESSENLRAYLKAAPDASDAEMVRKQLIQIETLAQASAPPNSRN